MTLLRYAGEVGLEYAEAVYRAACVAALGNKDIRIASYGQVVRVSWRPDTKQLGRLL
jgi:hypothetical protein